MTVIGWIIIFAGVLLLSIVGISIGIARGLITRTLTREGRGSIKKRRSGKKNASCKKDKQITWRTYSHQFDRGAIWFTNKHPKEVEITSEEGLRLTGYYLPHNNAVRTVLLVHGYHGRGVHDLAIIAKVYYKYQSNVLIINQRTHGESEGEYIGLGVKERLDCLKWIQYINEYLDSRIPIYLHGISMGASTVLMTAEQDLPENVVGIIADCGFTSPWEICKCVLRKVYHLPAFPVLYIANWMCKKRAGYSLKEASTMKALQKSTLPVLFVHGGKDTFVPVTMSQLNYKACKGKKELVIIENAPHALGYFLEPRLCEEKIIAFFEDIEQKMDIV